MSNTLLNPSIIAKETLMQLENTCDVGSKVFRGYEKEWMERSNGWKKGATITAKAPLHDRVKDGETIDVEDIREEDVSMIVNLRKHVAKKLTGTEMTLNIEEFSDRIIQPAIVAIVDYIDTTILDMYKYIPNQVGTPGSTPSNILTIGEAGAVLTDHSVPKTDRHCFIDPWAHVKMADSMKGLMNPEMVKKAVAEGAFGNLHGFNIYESQNIASHTCGTAAGLSTMLVDDTVAEGDTSITIDQNGSLAVTTKQGDIFTIASVNGVNLINGNSTGRSRQFVVEADTDASGNDAEVSCTPGVAPWNIYSSAATSKFLPYQNMDTLPADDAAVSFAGSASLNHKVNLAFHRHALAMFMVPVHPPTELKSYKINKNGYTITVAFGGDIINYVSYIRFDVLFGVKAINPFMACRIAG